MSTTKWIIINANIDDRNDELVVNYKKIEGSLSGANGPSILAGGDIIILQVSYLPMFVVISINYYCS